VVTSLLGGHLDALVQLPSVLASHVKAGTIRILAVLASQRDPAFPNVPTATEQGFKFQADFTRGVLAPRGTPPAVIARLQDAIQTVVNSPEFKARGASDGFVPAFQTASAFRATMDAEDAELAKRMARAGIKVK